jgi:hypothetical protein
MLQILPFYSKNCDKLSLDGVSLHLEGDMKKQKKLIEPCIYEIIGSNPQSYWIEISADNGRRKLRATAIGIRRARETKLRLQVQIKARSFTSNGKLKNITACLAYYLRKKYRYSSQWKIGSGKVKLHFWRDKIGKIEPKSLKKEDINVIIHEMQAEEYKNSGIKPYISTLKAALNYCNEEGKINIDLLNYLYQKKT